MRRLVVTLCMLMIWAAATAQQPAPAVNEVNPPLIREVVVDLEGLRLELKGQRLKKSGRPRVKLGPRRLQVRGDPIHVGPRYPLLREQAFDTLAKHLEHVVRVATRVEQALTKAGHVPVTMRKAPLQALRPTTSGYNLTHRDGRGKAQRGRRRAARFKTDRRRADNRGTVVV